MNFEANRRKILENLQKQKSTRGSSYRPATRSKPIAQSVQPTIAKSTHAIVVCVFGKKSLFMKNLVNTLARNYMVSLYDEMEVAIDFSVSNNVVCVILDIDPPSDYHMAINVLTAVKTLLPEVKLLVCTKDRNDSRARSMVDHGCLVLEKPVSSPEIMRFIDG